MCIGRWVMAENGKLLPSLAASSSGGYQNGIGSKKRSTRAR